MTEKCHGNKTEQVTGFSSCPKLCLVCQQVARNTRKSFLLHLEITQGKTVESLVISLSKSKFSLLAPSIYEQIDVDVRPVFHASVL